MPSAAVGMEERYGSRNYLCLPDCNQRVWNQKLCEMAGPPWLRKRRHTEEEGAEKRIVNFVIKLHQKENLC